MVQSEAFKVADTIMDAVFFPLLSKEAFLQECWRLELGENGQPELNGVVFNEVKHNFNDPSILTNYNTMYLTHPIPAYQYIFGGDPLEIPSITYEKFVETHKKYYRPDNALISYSGSMSVTQLIDFIADNYIPRLQKKFQLNETLPYWKSPNPEIPEFCRKDFEFSVPNIKQVETSCFVNYIEHEEFKSAVYMWGPTLKSPLKLISNLTLNQLADTIILPQLKKISETIECKIRRWIIKDKIFCSIDIDAIPQDKYQQTIDTLDQILETTKTKGLPQLVLKKILQALNYISEETLEIWRFDDLYDFAIFWAAGEGLTNHKREIEAGCNIVKRHIKKDRFLNKTLVNELLSMEPLKIKYNFVYHSAEEFRLHQLKQEQKLTAELFARTSKEEIIREMTALKKWQSKDSEKLIKEKFPYMNMQDAPVNSYNPKLTLKYIDEIPVIVAQSETHTIIPEISILFPMDHMETGILKQYELAEGLYSCLFAKNSYATEDVRFSNTMYSQKYFDEEAFQKAVAQYGNDDIPLRDYFKLTLCMLNDDISEAFKVFKKDNFPLLRKFTDEYKKTVKAFSPWPQSIFSESAMKYYTKRMLADITEDNALEEILSGYTGIKNMHDFMLEQTPEFFEKLEDFFGQLLNGGCWIYTYCQKWNQKTILKEIKKMIRDLNLTPLKPRINKTMEEYKKHILLADTPIEEIIPATTTIGSCHALIPVDFKLNSREALATDILCDWLTTNTIITKIRQEHGCYNATLYNYSFGYVIFATSRDPDPEKSIQILKQILRETAERKWTSEDYKSIQLSIFTDNSTFKSRDESLTQSLTTYIGGETIEFIKNKNKVYYSITPEEIHQAAVRLYQNVDKLKVKMIRPVK